MFKLFGGKKEDKKGDYFLELNEAEASTPVVEAPKEKKGASKKAEPKGKKGASKKAAQKEVEPAPVTVVEEPKYPPVSIAEIVRAKPVAVEEPPQVNFATDYLLTQTLSRRLPGPSLNHFKEIARQIKK